MADAFTHFTISSTLNSFKAELSNTVLSQDALGQYLVKHIHRKKEVYLTSGSSFPAQPFPADSGLTPGAWDVW